ncbi:hypothetical protein Taro_035588 [Colocasia esculenta]|uniref:Uncharacterized protein n=1 Tax=Colocasia esculenta TaxID=4460 RepID=A0A843W648_COLES|nr:hypothetical protein [Colocasia esculenta]
MLTAVFVDEHAEGFRLEKVRLDRNEHGVDLWHSWHNPHQSTSPPEFNSTGEIHRGGERESLTDSPLKFIYA